MLVVLTLAALSAEIDWTRKGYFVVTAPDGTYVSRHVNEIEAAMSAANHAFQSGNTGQLVYKVESPYFEVSLVVPEVQETEPEPAPDPPVDTGEELDPNTVYVCDGGEAGTTVELTGRDTASGGLIDGNPDPVLTLQKAEQLLAAGSEGTDLRLCEGGVWDGGEAGTTVELTGRDTASGGLIDGNPDPVLTLQKAEQLLAAGSEGTDLRLCEGGVWENQSITIRQSGSGVGDYEAQTVVGCYKVLNGVPRPCMDAYPRCYTERRIGECVDSALELRSSSPG